MSSTEPEHFHDDVTEEIDDLEIVDEAESDQPTSAADHDDIEDSLDAMQAQRTQVISTADLLPVEDDDQGQLEAEHSTAAPPPSLKPGRAHECLEIRTPTEEFETYVRARIETLTRLGETDQVEVMLNALELGKQKLRGSSFRRY